MLNLKRRTRQGTLITLLLIMVAVLIPGVQAAQSPVIVAGEITNKGDYSLTFDLAIANPAGTEGQFTVTVDGTAVKVIAVENTNTVGKIKLSLEKKASSGQVVVVEYVKSEDPALQLKSAEGAAVEGFTYGQPSQPVLAVPPVLTADSTDNQLGQAVELTYASNPDWSGKITNVKVDDVSVRGQYSITDGRISINAGTFSTAKEYLIVVKATGYEDASVTQPMTAKAGEEPKPVSPGLSDIKGHWAEPYINQMITAGVAGGYPDGTFKPDAQISRSEFVTLLVKTFKLEVKTGKIFDDTANSWAKDYISTATAYGITAGYNDSIFGANDPITREQMAVMLVKAGQYQLAGEGKAFADGNQISLWARDAISIATQQQIMSGYDDNTFRPQNNASRAEAVTVLARSQK